MATGATSRRRPSDANPVSELRLRGVGRPGLVTGLYFRMLVLGCLDGIGSERGIAWRATFTRSVVSLSGPPLTLYVRARSLPRKQP